MFGPKSSAWIVIYFLFQPGYAVVFFRVVLTFINTELVLSLLDFYPNGSCVLFDLIVKIYFVFFAFFVCAGRYFVSLGVNSFVFAYSLAFDR